MIFTPLSHPNPEVHRKLLAQSINQLIPIVKSLSLASSATTTVVADERMSAEKMAILVPTSSAASTENYFITPGDKRFTVNHSSASTARNFQYLIVG